MEPEPGTSRLFAADNGLITWDNELRTTNYELRTTSSLSV